HVRQLLAPRGVFILVEGTKPTRFTDLTFGLTDGWWRFADLHLRHSHPFLSTSQWHELLTKCGFREPTPVPAPQWEGSVKLCQAVIVARAAEAEAMQPTSFPGRWLIFADRGGAGQSLRALLEARGDTCVLVFAGACYAAKDGSWCLNPASLGDFERLCREVL